MKSYIPFEIIRHLKQTMEGHIDAIVNAFQDPNIPYAILQKIGTAGVGVDNIMEVAGRNQREGQNITPKLQSLIDILNGDENHIMFKDYKDDGVNIEAMKAQAKELFQRVLTEKLTVFNQVQPSMFPISPESLEIIKGISNLGKTSSQTGADTPKETGKVGENLGVSEAGLTSEMQSQVPGKNPTPKNPDSEQLSKTLGKQGNTLT